MRKILCFGVVLAACGVLEAAFPQTLSGKKYVTLESNAAGKSVTARAVVAVTPESGSPDAYKLGGLWIGRSPVRPMRTSLAGSGSVRRIGRTAGIFSLHSVPPPNSRRALWSC